MAVGRISGPLLKDNLLRNGVNLAFETSLLYLDVVNSRVGINTTTPTNDLSVNGTISTTNLTVTSSATLGTITVSNNTISSTNGTINLTPSGSNAVVYQGTISVGNLNITGNTISDTVSNDSINITASGTGQIKLNSNTLINGNLHATGSITADGNIQLGAATNDTVSFTGEVNSNILPSATNTYNLGSNSLQWNNVYSTNATITTINATTVNTSDFQTAQLDITGNTISAINSNTDININTTGAGSGIILDNLKFSSNSITNVVSNAITQFNETTTSVTFTGSVALGTATSFTARIDSGAVTQGLPGTILTVTSAPSGTFDGSLQFNGSNYLTLSSPITMLGQAYTFECFFYCSSFGSIQSIIGSNTPGNGGLSIWINNTTTIQVDRDGYDNNQYTFATPFSTNTWHHLAVTKNSTGQTMVFVDGVRSTSGYGTAVSYAGTTSVIGVFNSSYNYFTGNLTQIKLTVGTNYYDPTASSITVPNSALTVSTNTKLLLLVTSGTTYLTDTSGIQTLTNTGSVAYSGINPFGAATSGIQIGMVLTGTGIATGTYIASNISGTATSSTSTWQVSINQSVTSLFMTATPILLTVSSPSGTVQTNMTLTGTGLSAGSFIISQASGTAGGAGVYNITPYQTVSSTTITGTITGYVKMTGTYGFVIPSGSTSARPLNGYDETGMIRYNTDYNYVEIFNGTVWTSVAGTSSGVTASQAQDIGVQTALAIG